MQIKMTATVKEGKVLLINKKSLIFKILNKIIKNMRLNQKVKFNMKYLFI